MNCMAVFTDEPIAGIGLASLLAAEQDFHVVGTWDNPASLAYLVGEEKPDLLLLDWQGGASLPLVADIRRKLVDCKVVCWARAIPTELAYALLDLGVAGILPKTVTGHLLVSMLRRIANGEQCTDESLFVPAPPPNVVRLTNRENQILSLVALGLKNREMATALSISEGTLKVYISRLLQKTGTRDRYQLANYRLKRPAEFFNASHPDGSPISGLPAPRRGDRATPWLQASPMSRSIS